VTNPLQSDFILGFLGAGQLARMSASQAFRLGIQVGVFSDRPENEPVQFMTPHSSSASFDDVDALAAFAKKCDVVTLENEFIDSEVLRKVRDQSGVPMFPSPETFERIENKLIEKQTFENAGIPVTPYKLVSSEQELMQFGGEHGWPILLKSSKGGYDGYGNEKADNLKEAIAAFDKLGGNSGHDILAEAFVDFTHELAVQVARNQAGTVVYPCCETVQRDHICVAVKIPAPISSDLQDKAKELAIAATEAIDGKGIFAYEFFLTRQGELLVNESAPRPHNSGHYSIEGCVASQFENHVRAVLDLPLGDTSLRKPAAVMINLLGTDSRPAQAEHALKALEKTDGHLHMYGKLQSKPGRKMGHYTLLGNDPEALYREAISLTENIRI
jgi:5-(carboxyamino)imidazole ribonucleotide synthase